MKRITLLTANVTNAGAFLDSGATVDIGDENDQISAARAEAAVTSGGAEDATAPEPSGTKPRK